MKRKRRAERFVLDEAEIDDDSDSVSLDEGEEQIGQWMKSKLAFVQKAIDLILKREINFKMIANRV